MYMTLCRVFLIGLIFLQTANATSLLPVEKKINHYVIQHQAEQLSLLEQLVNINSGTTNISGVHEVGKLLRQQFNKLGFTTQWIAEPVHMHRASTLVANHPGNSGKRLLLIGHLDTVFSPDSSFKKFERHQNRAIGPGVVDDKGGDVVILFALKALDACQALENTTITVVLTGDEEDSGKPAAISRKPLFDAAHQSDVALDFEGAITLDTASIDRRGITNWRLIAHGNEGHSSDIFHKSVGYGANFELIRILNTMRTQLSKEKYLTFNPGLILGGTMVNFDPNKSQGVAFGKENVIANTATAIGDLRFLSPEQKLAVEERMRAIVKQHLPETTTSILFQDGIPAMPPTDNNLSLLKKYSDVSNSLGYGPIKPLNPGARGAGDISYIAPIVAANLVGLGPLGTGLHSTKETLDIASLTIQTQRAALLIYRLTH